MPAWTAPVALAILLASGCSDRSSTRSQTRPAQGPPVAEVADRIYRGGDVVTMDARDTVAEALAVGGERILAVGSEAEVLRFRGPETEVMDLAGRAVLPGFVDAHGHLLQMARVAPMANLAPPPVGAVASLEDLQRGLRAWAEAHERFEGGWVLGNGYDDSLLAERRHPTRFDLDAVAPDRPVLAIHASLHLAVANGRALEIAGITSDTPDPPGGVIRRIPGSREPDGILEETAFFGLLDVFPTPTLDMRLAALDAAQAIYARHGVTTAQEGSAGAEDVALLREAAARDRLKIDVVVYARWNSIDEAIGPGQAVGEYRGRLKVGGAKLILDGSPQGKTAWLSEPYHEAPPGRPPSYRGYPTMPDAEVEAWVRRFFERGWQVLAHVNGDAAGDQLLRSVAQVSDTLPPDDRRTVMVHAQTVREDQLDRMQALGIVPSFFVSHTFFWGDWHLDSVLGPERAARISPARSARQRGMHFTFHNDSPVVPPDVLHLIWTAVNRRTRAGAVLGPDQTVDVATAIRAVTWDAAWQHFEEDRKGSLEAGKLADLVILSASPLRVDPMRIRDLEVVETIKEGRVIASPVRSRPPRAQGS